MRRVWLFSIVALLVVGPSIAGRAGASAGTTVGAVYAMSNDAAANEVLIFDRLIDGTLVSAGSIATGGTGSGVLLDSQGALIRRNAVGMRWVFAANAGSSNISSFTVNPDFSLTFVNIVTSGGTEPVSVSAFGTFLYAANRGSDNVSGFTITSNGLVPLDNSTRSLSGTGVGPGQVQFSPNGSVVMVTERTTQLIDTFTVGSDGLLTGPLTHPSPGIEPFGFGFRGRTAVVSEAGSGAASSYRANSDGSLTLVSASVPNGQRLPCWTVITGDGLHAYVANHGSADVSSYSLAQDGTLTLLNGRAGRAGNGPEDLALSKGSAFLYVLNFDDGTISAFSVQADGSLLAIAGIGGLPAGTVGGLTAV